MLAAQARPMIGHRGTGIKELISRIESGLQAVFQTTQPVIISTSSATGLMEAGVRNGAAGGPILSLVNGAFSARFAEIGRTCGLAVEQWDVPYGEVHSPQGLAQRLEAGRYRVVTLTHSETSTGALQDLAALATVTAAFEDTLLLVDSVTGIGGVETRTDDWDIDFILTGSQKALALPPGLGFAVASQPMMERSRRAPDRGWYFDLERLLDELALHQTPATPAISLLYALDVQLERMAGEGIEGRWKRHLEMQGRTFEWVDEMRQQGVGLELFAAEGHRSPTVTCIRLPESMRAPEVVDRMAKEGWVIGGGYGPLKRSTIRIGHMGDHTVEELNELLSTLGEVLR